MKSIFSLKELSNNILRWILYICFRRVTTVSGVGAKMLGGRVPAFSHSLLKKKKLHHEKAIFPKTPFFDGITFLSTTINYQQFFPPFSFTPLSLRSPSLYEQAGPLPSRPSHRCGITSAGNEHDLYRWLAHTVQTFPIVYSFFPRHPTIYIK